MEANSFRGITASGRILKIKKKFTKREFKEKMENFLTSSCVENWTLPELLERKDFVVYFVETTNGKGFIHINCANYAPFNTY